MVEKTIQGLKDGIHAQSLIEAVVSAIPAPVFYKDAAGKYLGCNEAFEQFVGLKKEDMIGKGVFELWDEDLAQVYHEADQALLNAGGKQIYEARVTYADGSIRDVMFHKAVFSAEFDQLCGMVGVMLDITEQKKLERSLKQSQELFSQAFQSNPGLIALSDPVTGEHIDVNEAWLSSLKFERDDVIGKTAFDMDIWPNLDDRKNLLKELEEKGSVRNFEATLKAKDGTLLNCNIAIEKIQTDARDLVLWTANNITERRKAEEASEAKSVFLSNMSHEFRTPLNGILGFAQLLRMNSDQNLTEKQIGWINNINSSGSLLLEIVNDVLDLARIESGRIEYHPETLQPREVFKECFNILKPLAAKRNIELKGLPQTERFVHVDRSKLKQTLLNLVSNAVKYNKENGFVEFGCRAHGPRHIDLYVQDNGLGIPEDEVTSIFEPFHRVSDHTSLADGTGVGLSIVKKNVELMEGEITVTSTPGKGTCFTITLPSVTKEEPDLPFHFDI